MVRSDPELTDAYSIRISQRLGRDHKHAGKHKIKITHVYREEEPTGAEGLEKRPALIEMMAAMHSKGTGLVLVEGLDRLARCDDAGNHSRRPAEE